KRPRSEFLQGNEIGMDVFLPGSKSIKINREDWGGIHRERIEDQISENTDVLPDFMQEMVSSGISSEELLQAYLAQQSLDREPRNLGAIGHQDRLDGTLVDYS